MKTALIDVTSIAPLTRNEAIDLGRVEYRRFLDALRPLDAEGWGRPTDCTAWTVRDLAGHVIGMMDAVCTIRGFAFQQVKAMRRGAREGIDGLDAMTALQVESVADLTPAGLVARGDELVDPAVAGRRRAPRLLAERSLVPQEVNGAMEKWTLSFLYGAILTRDTWLHRVADVARAVEAEPLLDAEHDGRIVADVVVEWTRRHSQPVELSLTGPAGGRFRSGTGGPTIELDTIEFSRMLTGRETPTHPLLETSVPF